MWLMTGLLEDCCEQGKWTVRLPFFITWETTGFLRTRPVRGLLCQETVGSQILPSVHPVTKLHYMNRKFHLSVPPLLAVSCSGQHAELCQIPKVHLSLRNFVRVHGKEARKVALKHCNISVLCLRNAWVRLLWTGKRSSWTFILTSAVKIMNLKLNRKISYV
jgi:hypothetical protein